MRGYVIAIGENFPIGDIYATRGAAAALPDDAEFDTFLPRHALGEQEKAVNEAALAESGRLRSSYLTKSGVRFWVIIAADGSETSFLLPEEDEPCHPQPAGPVSRVEIVCV